MTDLSPWIKKQLAELDTDPLLGLTKDEAGRRLAQYNQKARKYRWKQRLIQWVLWGNGIAVGLLLTALVLFSTLASLHNEYISTRYVALAVLLLIGVLLDAMLRLRRDKTVSSLWQNSSPKATVIRGGAEEKILVQELVLGDIVLLEAGDYVSANLLLLENRGLQFGKKDALQGRFSSCNCTPSTKNKAGELIAEDFVSSGSIVICGSGRGVVTASQPHFGTTGDAGGINCPERTSAELPRLFKTRISPQFILLGECAVIFFVGLACGEQLQEILLLSLALAASAAPDRVFSASQAALALGAQRMEKHGINVRHLSTIEALNQMSVVCIDVLDILPQEELAVQQIWPAGRELETVSGKLSPQALHLLRLGAICNNAYVRSELDQDVDPIQAAIASAAEQCGMSLGVLEQEYPKVEAETSVQGCTNTVHRVGSRCIEVLKGDMGIILSLCSDTDTARAMEIHSIMLQSHKYALAIAYREVGKTHRPGSGGYTFMGLIALMRSCGEPDFTAVTILQQAGIKPVLATEKPASATGTAAKEFGLLSRGPIVTGTELCQMSQQQLERHIQRSQVFTSVTPAQKVRIIQAYQNQGLVVAATGRSVWDSPLLNAADIGFAMGTSCPSACASADISTDGGLDSFALAVRQSRCICENKKQSILFLLTCLIGQGTSIFFSFILGFGSPLSAPHLLMHNFILCPLLVLALCAEPKAKKYGAAPTKRDLVSKKSVFMILIHASVLSIVTLSGFALGAFVTLTTYFPASPAMGITASFWVLYFSSITSAFCFRSHRSLFRTGFFSSKALMRNVSIAIAAALIITLFPCLESLFCLVELSILHWIYLLLLSALPLLAGELIKLFFALQQRFS